MSNGKSFPWTTKNKLDELKIMYKKKKYFGIISLFLTYSVILLLLTIRIYKNINYNAYQSIKYFEIYLLMI